MIQILMTIVVFSFFGALFYLSYKFNKRTPIPEGCIDLKQICKSCSHTRCPNKIITFGGSE